MKKILFLFFFLPIIINCQPTIEWKKCYGGSLGEDAWKIEPTADGGAIIAGQSMSNNGDVSNNHGGGDLWVLKINSLGLIEWQKCYGGTNLDGIPTSIKRTADGGYILIGRTYSNNNGDISGFKGGFHDIWVCKINSSGVIQWQNCFGGTSNEEPYSIINTNDGGYIFTGFTTSNNGDVSGNHGSFDLWIVKINSLGTIQWQKCYGGTSSDSGNDIRQTNDGGYIVCGETSSTDGDVTGLHNNSGDGWIIKITNQGIIQWQKCLGGSNVEATSSILETIDGGFITLGSTESNDADVSGNHGFTDVWVVKTNSVGLIQWQKCLGGSNYESGQSMERISNGNYIIGAIATSTNGDCTSNYGNNDLWVIEIDGSGNIIWQKAYGGSLAEVNCSVQQLTDGGFIVSGTTYSNDNDVNNNHGQSDIFILKLSPVVGIGENKLLSDIIISPNPATNILKITSSENRIIESVMVIDALGRKVLEQNENTFQINIQSLDIGLYQLILKNEGKDYFYKFIKE